MTSKRAPAVNKNRFSFARAFDAPRDLVWRMWAEPEHFRRWWGPAGCEMHTVSIDIRPGGSFHYAMRFRTGAEMWGLIRYRELVSPERLVYVSSFSNPQGEVTRAPFSEVFPLELHNVISFEERAGKTTVTLVLEPLNASDAEIAKYIDMFGSMEKGFGGTLDQLDAYLKQQ